MQISYSNEQLILLAVISPARKWEENPSRGSKIKRQIKTARNRIGFNEFVKNMPILNRKYGNYLRNSLMTNDPKMCLF